jgi:hypothetical protein
MTFWTALRATYGGSIAFLIACPLLALIPVVFELLQHMAEVHIGMYDSIAAAKAVEHHPMRIAFGMLKIAALTVPIYWVTRFLPHRDARFAATFDPLAARLFAAFLVFALAFQAIQLWVTPKSALPMLATFVVGEIVTILILPWAVAAALGNRAVGIRASSAIMARHIPWTFGLVMVAVIPLLIPHYAFAALAITGPKMLLWPTLIVDSLLVGWMTAVMAASGYYAAARAAAEAGVELMPVGAVASEHIAQPA